MHELGICREILDFVISQAKGKRVLRIKVEIPQEEHLTAQLFKEIFKIVSYRTNVEGANIDVTLSSIDAVRVCEIDLED
ncbi:MAG: hydrogenase/urease maturation nickel metallochaperone HypA [Candidatus Omnitrophica bacterium]|nr:hydrogenase/urease maturation nickel metallochaperone HypA [Candidatus Omnitrophota bacterium]MCM8826561.1 hydrogenase/urease maturation nickel metallochaperone HypA [Candidatus Omnitrophota bacterium]